MKKTNSLDSSAKSIISNKSLVARLLKNEVEEYKDLSVKEIEKLIEQSDGESVLGIGNEDDYSGSRRIRYDLLITPRLPNSDEKIAMYINVEMQNTSDDETLLKRAIYYSSSLISRQPKDIKDFTYKGLKKVYSIWICTNPKKDRKNTIVDYNVNPYQRYGRKIDGLENSDILNIRFLNLSDAEPENSTLNILRLLFMNTGKNSKEVVKKLNEDYDIIMTEKEVKDMPGYGQFVYDTGFEEGMQKGLVSTIVNFIDSGIPKEQAFKITKADDHIKELVLEELKKEK